MLAALEQDEYIEMSLTLKDIKDPYIRRALKVPRGMLMSLREFIRYSKYPIDAFMMDRVFHNLDSNMLIYVTQELIDYMGYTGKRDRDRKAAFLKLLTNKKSGFVEGKDYWLIDNIKYNEYYKKTEAKFAKKSDMEDQPNLRDLKLAQNFNDQDPEKQRELEVAQLLKYPSIRR